jgi:hypothetical protein
VVFIRTFARTLHDDTGHDLLHKCGHDAALVQSHRFGQQEAAFQITESYPGRIDGLGAETWKVALTRVSKTLRTPTLQVYLTCVTSGDSSGAYTPQ